MNGPLNLQTALIFRELSPVKGKGMHAYIAASFAQTIDNHQGVPLSRSGSLALLEKTMGRSSGMGDLFKHPKDHHLTNVRSHAQQLADVFSLRPAA